MIAVLLTIDPRYQVDRAKIREIIRNKLIQEGIADNAEVSVSIVGLRKMRELQKQYMDDGDDHDVLSFPLQETALAEPFVEAPDSIRRLGDIVISYPQAVSQAAEDQTLVMDKVKFLLEHALMHLLGHHHDDGIL